jgi:hypothetical protein
MEMKQRLVNSKISCYLSDLGRVIRKKGKFLVEESWYRWEVDISLTLIISKARLTRPSQISSAGVLTGRYRKTAFTGF